jgi:choline dehydrogenase-like flavoprotein
VTINRDNGLTDGLGLPRPVINYQLSEYTRRGFASAEVFSRQVYAMLGATNFTHNDQYLKKADGSEYPNPVWFENPDLEMFEALPDALKAPELCANKEPIPVGFTYFGAGHLVGTYRMGSDARTSVVDSYSRSWDHSNLFLVGDGVFPTITTANPTLTLAALAMRTSDAIKTQLAQMG